MNKILLVYNYPVDDISNQWLYKGLKLKFNNIRAIGINPFFQSFLYKKYYKWLHFIGRCILSFSCVTLAKRQKYDTIVIWDNTFIGVNVAFWSLLFRYKGRLFILNMIDHGNRLILLRKIIYSVFKRKNTFISVNNERLRQNYIELYGIDRNRFFILPDTCSNQDEILSFSIKDSRYIFSGGSSNRDWKCFIEVAKLCPNINFVGVARKSIFCNIYQETEIPSNVKMYFDIKGEEFFHFIADCSFVFLPLTSHVQAGQTVVIQAGLMEKTVVMNYTESISSYIDESNGVLYNFNESYENIALILDNLFFNKQLYHTMGYKLKNSMKKHTSEYVIDMLCNKLS